MPAPEGIIALLFTDIEGSTGLSKALPDAEYKRVTAEHDARIRLCLAEHGGHEVDTAGDRFFATFPVARRALDCAKRIQESLRDAPISAVDGEGKTHTVSVRIGVYQAARGVLVAPDGEYHDREANLGARIGALGRGGQILVSESAYKGHGNDYRWHEWPGRYLKDFDMPQDVYELLWDGRSRGEPGSRWLPDWYRRELNKFVGRVGVLGEIRDWLRENRHPLLTLVGIGGLGKTRLAVETVLTVGGTFPGGSLFVPLDRELTASDPAAVTPALLAAAVARACHAPDDVQASALATLGPWLAARKPSLLILDNWESAANAETAKWLGDLLNAAPPVRCLATSRVVMGLTTLGENLRVPLLDVPRNAHAPLADFDAYELFATRARHRTPRADLSDADAVARVLRATQGIPLGLELAAARVVDYPVAVIADGLAKSLLEWQRTPDELGDARPDAARHVSMAASLDWSVNLLPEAERAAFARLGVFPYDFDPAAASAVADIPADWLLRWHRASLLLRAAGALRYSLLPVTREYALSRLGPDADPLRRALVAHYYQVSGDNGGADGRNINDPAKRAVLDAEWRNLVAAIDAAESLRDGDRVRWIAANLFDFFSLRGFWSEWEQVGLRALAAARRSGNRRSEGTALGNLGNVYQRQGRLDEAADHLHQCIAAYREAGDREGEGRALNNMGNVYQSQGRLDEAADCYNRAVEIARASNNRVGEGRALNNMGIVYQSQGRLDEAADCYRQSLDIERETKDRVGEGRTLNNLGIVYKLQGRHAETADCYRQDLAICRESGDRIGEGQTLRNLALLHEAQGDVPGAVAWARQAVQALAGTQAVQLAEKARNTLVYLEGLGSGSGRAQRRSKVREVFRDRKYKDRGGPGRY